LLVHHGLFWDGLRPLTGRSFRRVEALIRGEVALYSSHLPLDAHPELGNGILLARRLGVEAPVPFGRAKGVHTGWLGSVPEEGRRSFQARIASAVDGPVKVIPGGPETLRRVAVVTGAAGSLVEEAAASGADALVTGEGGHQTFGAAMELGINLFYAGHYATETFGVEALAGRLEQEFGVPWVFLHDPSGL
jgi:dinuclear metal center YbgI/SA1388 family protein